MKYERSAGILLHPTSLPSPFGVGDFGPDARKFIDFLAKNRITWWQTLPLNPPGYGESPYQCFSAFAMNELLISPALLVQEDLLTTHDIKNPPAFDTLKVDFEKVKPYKFQLFEKAYNRFKVHKKPEDWNSFISENNYWLEDYCTYRAIKEYFSGNEWQQWDTNIAHREPGITEYYQGLLYDELDYWTFLQYTARKQWDSLKNYGNENGVKFMGDLPIFVSSDSSDTWTKRNYFSLDENGIPTKIAGVPPDYFSKKGQLWGNPHYIWGEMLKDDFIWWRNRMTILLKLNDAVRIDHFRGFESYWEIPGGAKDATVGEWVKAPGKELFYSIKKHMGDLPIVAEDLGVITPEVKQLKETFGFPGMKILQFAFGRGSEARFMPDSYEKKSIVYTGTHDNNTTIGYYSSMEAENPEAFEKMLEILDIEKADGPNAYCWKLISVAMECSSMMAIIPMQDFLLLDESARMNLPNTIGGNWLFRFKWSQILHESEERIRNMIKQSGRQTDK